MHFELCVLLFALCVLRFAFCILRLRLRFAFAFEFRLCNENRIFKNAEACPRNLFAAEVVRVCLWHQLTP
jgi:hypothetical protein